MERATIRPARWSKQEDELLRRRYPDGGISAVRCALPGRTQHAIYQRAHDLGLRCRPGVRGRNIAAALAPLNDTEERRAMRIEDGRRNFDRRMSPEARARSHAPEARAKAAAALRGKRAAWCPSEYDPLYVRLIRSKRMRAADAKALVLAQIAADMALLEAEEARRVAALSPFERQLELARAGAPVIRRWKPPAADYPMTLGGNTMGVLA